MSKIFVKEFFHSGRLCDKSATTLLNEYLDANPSVELKDFKVTKEGNATTIFSVFEIIDKKGYATKVLDEFIAKLEIVNRIDNSKADTLRDIYRYIMRNCKLNKHDAVIKAIEDYELGEIVFYQLSGHSFQKIYNDIEEDK